MSIVTQLDDKQFNGYMRHRIPHELDDIVEKVVVAYRSALQTEKHALVSELSSRGAGVLSSFGERIAATAVRTRSEESLRRGLVAMGMAESRLDDPRTNLIVLAAVNHSATTIGTDLSRLIADVAADLPDSAVASFRAFAERNERDKSLQSMGLGTAGSGEEFRYVSA